MNTFFTSDTHYNHKNIVRGITEWKQFEPKSDAGIQTMRDFDTLEEHNEKLIANFNEVVGQDDILYHLGDWSFGGFESIMAFKKRLICQNIHLIFGNHDHHIERNRDGIQGAFKSVQYYKELPKKEYHIIMSHYAMRVWNKSHRGSIMLYGHSHGSLPSYGRSMDVGVDTNDLYPYHLDEILSKFKNVDVKFVDHHSKTTN